MADDDDRQGPPRKRVRFDYDSSPRRVQNDNSDDDRDERQQDTQVNVAEDALPFPASERDRASMFFRMFLARMASPILHFTHSPTSHPPTTDVHDDTMAMNRDDEGVSHVEAPAPTSVDEPAQENSPPRTDIQARVMEIEQLVHGNLTDTRRTDRPTGDGGAIEDSNTDDEDLQQLSMVIGDSSNALLTSHSLATVHRYLSSEVSFDDVQELVFHSVKEQKKALVEKLFKIIKATPNGADTIARLVQAEDEAGLSLLMICVRHEMLDLCEMLVNEGADVNQCNEKRPVALLIAAQKGHEDATRFLLERGANEESKNMSLIPAAHFGHLGVVRILLEFGADQNFSNKKGTTPLMRAAQEGRDEVVQFLIDKGAVAYAANNEGMTALMLAAQRGHANIATILITAGSDVNTQTRQGSTALLLAAKRGHTAAVEALMTAGADIFLKDDRHKTAAETAHRRGHLELFLKITVSNQIRLMREGLRRERYAELMRLSHLYVLSRATLAPAFKSPRRKHMHELLDRTMRLPRPLLQSIALFLPMCNVWDRQLKYLAYEAPFQPSKVVQNGIRILDDILVSVVLDARSSLEYFRRSYPQARGRHLALLRDSDEFRDIFMDESHLALYPELLAKLRRMADIQGALSSYPAGVAIQFGVEVAQDVVALVADMLRWDESRKRAMVRGSEPEAFTLTDYFTRTRVDI